MGSPGTTLVNTLPASGRNLAMSRHAYANVVINISARGQPRGQQGQRSHLKVTQSRAHVIKSHGISMAGDLGSMFYKAITIYWNIALATPGPWDPEACCNTWYRPKLNLSWTQISRNLVHPEHPFQWSNRFENLHRARQWHCRVLCKISKRFDSWGRHFGQTRFCKIWD